MRAGRQLDDVCLQDPMHETAYLIPGGVLPRFAVIDAASVTDATTVAFTVSNDSLLDEIAAGTPASWSENPDVLIRDSDSGGEFHLTFDQLQDFEVGLPEVHPEAKTYTFPMPQALVAEMPAAVRALLQNAFTQSTPEGDVLRGTD